MTPKPTDAHRKSEPAAKPAAPSFASRIPQYLTSLAVPLSIAAFGWAYHVVLPSDDVFSMRVLRKESGSFSGTVVFVPKLVDDYNRATGEGQDKLERSYLYRRLLQTGIVRRSE